MTERRIGQWPVDRDETRHDYADDEVTLFLQRAAERGRREIVLGSIRAHLEEQPTANAVQSATRHWIADLGAFGDVGAMDRGSTS